MIFAPGKGKEMNIVRMKIDQYRAKETKSELVHAQNLLAESLA